VLRYGDTEGYRTLKLPSTLPYDSITLFAEGFRPEQARIPRCANTIDTISSARWITTVPGASRADEVPTFGTAAVAERRRAKPLLDALGVARAAITYHSIICLAIVVCRLGAGGCRYTNMIRRVGLPPHVALFARVRAVCAAGWGYSAGGCGIVRSGLRSSRGNDADMVVGIGFTPNIT
jgi:hypothetical protein